MALLAAAGVAYVAVLGVLVLWWNGQVDDARRALDVQQSHNSTLEREIVAFSDAADLVVRYDSKADLVRSALSSDVDWGVILNDLARLVPPRLWVETFSGSVAPETIPGVVGQVGFSGVGFDFPDVSAWLRALDSQQFGGLTGTWVNTISQGVAGTEEVVNFTSTAALTTAALSNRVEQLIPAVP